MTTGDVRFDEAHMWARVDGETVHVPVRLFPPLLRSVGMLPIAVPPFTINARR